MKNYVITIERGYGSGGRSIGMEIAKKLGIDTVITDHHECPDVLPEAIAVINPKRKDTTYPFSSLAGVGKRYLGKEYDNLITCDFSCEGFASHEIYKQYIEGIEKKLRGKVKEVNFRAKLDGWMTHSIKIDAENGRSYKSFAKADPYFYSFLYKQMGLREYCMECGFAANHYADIVIADFWAYKRVSRVENDNTGLSLVIANSKNGEHIIETLQKSLALTELCLEDASYNMKERSTSEEELSGKRAFISECQKDGFMKTAQKRYTLASNTKMKVRSSLGKIKRLIK